MKPPLNKARKEILMPFTWKKRIEKTTRRDNDNDIFDVSFFQSSFFMEKIWVFGELVLKLIVILTVTLDSTTYTISFFSVKFEFSLLCFLSWRWPAPSPLIPHSKCFYIGLFGIMEFHFSKWSSFLDSFWTIMTNLQWMIVIFALTY